MPNSEVRWMNSRRGIPSSSAALPLETRLRRYNSNTIISRAVCPIGWPRVARKPLRSSPRSRMVESITDAPSSWYRSLPGAENTSVPCGHQRRHLSGGQAPLLDGVVLAVGDVHVALRIHRHPAGIIQPGDQRAHLLRAYAPLLDGVVGTVRDIDVAWAIHRHCLRGLQAR